MTRINRYTVKLVREESHLYDLESKNIKSPSDASDIINLVLGLNDSTVEKFGIITLNIKNAVAGIHIISIGTLNASLVHPREVFQQAILNNANAIILFHNHPSGDPTPSSEDIQTTNKLIQAGEILGIKVLDHIIVGDGIYVSLKEKGLI